MKKTYWWRIITLILSTSIVFGGLIYEKYFCFAVNYDSCPFDKYRLIIFEPAVIMSLSLFVMSLLLFFINDLVFKKWLKFAIAWFVLASVFIYLAPTYSTQVVGNPTKESISIWMGSLFVIISLVQIILEHKKSKRK